MVTRFYGSKGKRRRALKKACLGFIIIAWLVMSISMSADAAIVTGSSTTASSGGAYSVTIDKPTGTVAGDVLVACIVASTSYSSVDVSPPDTSWTIIRTTNAQQSWYYDMVTYYKVAGTNEPAAYTWGSSFINTSGSITRLTGIDINRVVDASAESQGLGDSTSVIATAPSVTTTAANDVVIHFYGSYAALASPYFTEWPAIPSLSPLFEWAPAYPGSGSYDPPSIAGYHWTKASAGGTGTRDCILTKRTGTSSVMWVAQTIAFKAAPTVGFQYATSSDVEGETSRQVNITLSSPAAGPITVYYAVSGTASPTNDYTVTASPCVIPAGQSTGYLSIHSLPDDLYENDETVVLTLTGATGAILGGNGTYTHTITNDDFSAPTSVITPIYSTSSVSPVTTYPPSSALQVLQIQNPGAVAGDFMLAAITRHGSTWSQTIVPPAGWNLIRETYYANTQGLKLATYYKFAGSNEPTSYTWGIPEEGSMTGYHASGGITRYTGVDAIAPIDVSVATSGTMPLGASGTVNIPSVFPNHTNDRIVAVVGIFNPVTGITAPAGMTEQYEIKHSISPYNSFDREWPTTQMSDLAWAPATGTGMKTATVERFLTNQNTDWISQTIALKTSRLSISDVSFAEGNSSSANAIVTVSLDHPTNVPVTFNWLTGDGTAIAHFPNQAGDDYMVSGGSNYTIPAGQTSYDLVVPILGDTVLEPNETFRINLTGVTGATVADGQGTVTILDNDSNVTINDISQNEGNAGTTNFNFTVTLSPGCALPVSVTYFIPANEGTASQGTDYAFTQGTVELAAGQTIRTISVPVVGDTVFEPNETFVVYMNSATNANIADNRGLATILNDDVQLPTLSVNDVNRVEGNSGASNMVFTVSLSAASASNVSVHYATANGTATVGSDYTSTTGTLNIAAGQTSGTISVPIIGDTSFEPNETFSVNLTTPTNATIGDSTGLGTINNDDVLTMSVNDATLAEGNTGITDFVFTVTLTGASSSPVTILCSTTNGTATAGPDYNGLAGQLLTFNPGETSKTFTIQVNGETVYETDETFLVNLSNATGATLSDGQGVGTILNDDAVPSFALTMAVSPNNSGSATDLTGTSPYVEGATVSISAAPVTGYHFVNWTAPAGSFANANTAMTTFAMPAQAVAVTANFAPDTYTVTFNSQGGGAVTNQTIMLGGLVVIPTNPIRSGYAFAGWFKDSDCTDDWVFAEDTVTSDLTLYARWAFQDQYLESTGASFATGTGIFAQTFTAGITGGLYKASCYLYNQTAITLTTEIQAVTADGLPNGTILASSTVNVPAVPAFGAARWVDSTFAEPLSITAGDRFAIVWSGLSLESGSSLEVHNTDSYAGGKALRYFVSSWLDYFAPDFVFRTFVLTSPGVATTPATGLVTTESGGTDTFAVVLQTQPAADVTVDIGSLDMTEGMATPTSLTFTPSNWNTPQTVTITGVDDDLADGDIPYTVTATASSTDLGYHGMTANVSVVNMDAEGTAPVVSANPVPQNITYGTNASFTAAATGIPSPSIQWQVSTDGGGSYSDIGNGGVYSGATTSMLSLTQPPVSYTGYQYRALFTNGINPEAFSGAATLNVAPMEITGSFTAANKAYDGTTDATVTGRDLTGVLSLDVVTLTGGTAAFADKNVGTGKTVTMSGASLAGTDAGNYSLSAVADTTADITPKLVSPVIIAEDKAYDGTTAATLSSQTVSGLEGTDAVSLNVGSAAFADEDVGTWTVTATTLSLSGADAGNYALASATAADKAEITALSLTVNGAIAQDKPYDGDNAATVNFAGASLAGIMNGDVVGLDSASAAATFPDKNVGTDRMVTVLGIVLSGADAANYTMSQPTGLMADITPKRITGSFASANKAYDGTTTAQVADRDLTGVLTPDAVTMTGGIAAFADKNVGTGKMVTLNGAGLTGADAGNYILTSVANATADITPKPVVPVIVADDKAYDGNTSAILSSQSVSGLISPDLVTLLFEKADFADKDVGTWTVTATNLSLGGADAGNYMLSEPTAADEADITARELTISGAVAEDKMYDGDNTATVNFAGASLVGIVAHDDASIDSSSCTATFPDKKVGTDKIVTVHGMTLKGDHAANYTVIHPSGLTADITALGITGIFTAEDKVYDGTTAATVSSRSLTGVLDGDNVSLAGVAVFDDKHAGTGKTVKWTGAVLSDSDAGNYSLTSVADTTADILVRAIEVTAVTGTKPYDGTMASNQTPVITSVLGLAAGDSAIWTQTYNTKDAGSNKTLTPAGSVQDNNGGANYDVTFVPVQAGVITRATLTVTAENKTSQFSDSREPFTAGISGFVSGETLANSDVTGSPSYTTNPELDDPITQEPGSYSIIPDQGTLTANNYSFLFVNGVYTVTQEEAVLTFDTQNPVSVRVIATDEGNAAFIWQARVSQTSDGNPGSLHCIDKSMITLVFSAVGSGGGWSGTATQFDPDTGIVTFEVPGDVLGIETYAAELTLTSSCFDVAPAEDVLVIYDPSLGFTTGGGWFYWPDGTANPELAGAKTNFGFTMKYNRKGTSVQGSFLLIAHLPDGGIVRIKSNVINGLAILQNTYPGIASIGGKCVYRRVDADGNVLVEAGNQNFFVYVQDMDEPGQGTDMFWFNTELTISGENLFSLDSDMNSKVDEGEYVSLGGGNIVVPHKASSAVPDDEQAPPSNPKKK